ncbi:hypothetical protein CRE_02962 [Caenorhabditis remanei]|uniref:PDZ domain-containing protein n=1 Tax=Caenorhabditis remanei TaxID=31234 RepID=E3LWX7_CAERE|nr:hypothetical protein CRE_02962 [Caenorhabditis remanei]
MSKKKEFWLKPLPPNVPLVKTVVSFKIADQDVGRPPAEVMKIDEDMMISFISANSYFNGLIMGDKVVKVNDFPGKAAKCLAEILKGEKCQIEVLRRKGAYPATKERLARVGAVVKKGHACFLVDVERAPNVTTTSVGLKLGVMKKRGYVTKIEDDSIATTLIGRGDSIIDMGGDAIPFNDNYTDTFVREHLSKVSTGSKMSFLIERPIILEFAKEHQKYIESITYEDSDIEMAKDVVDIGRRASNMHFIIFKKMTPTSILSEDVRRQKKTTNKTTEAGESNISVSVSSSLISFTCSTTNNISSDVSDPEDLKPVVTKSHAAGSSSDSGGAFDDE